MNLSNAADVNLSTHFGDDAVDHMVPEGCFGLMGSVMVDGGDRYPVCATAFDTVEELIWMGNSGGHLTSYYSTGLDKYTSFQAHPTNEIRQILSSDVGVLALTKNHLKCNTRQGLGVFNFTSDNFIDMNCMAFSTQFSNSVIIGGYQQSLVSLDLNRVEETKNVVFREHNCAVLRVNDKFVFSGDTSGRISLRNLNTLQTMQILEAHSGTLSDFDVCGTKLVTCGFSNRSGVLQCDRFLMIYDLRTLRAMAPMPLPFDPYCLRFMPTYSDSRLLVASQTGQFQVLELASSNNAFIHQVETQGSFVYSMDASPSKQCVTFGDGAGFLHLFSDRAHPTFNECARPTEFPDPVKSLFYLLTLEKIIYFFYVIPFQPVSFEENLFPLSLIPTPLPVNGQFLSDWPQHLCRRVYRKPLPIDPEILKTMKVTQFVGYAPNRINRKPNQVPYDLKSNPIRGGKSTKHFSSNPLGESTTNQASKSVSVLLGDEEESLVPKIYAKVTVKYSKSNGEEFNYKNYNSTMYTGLESAVANSYVNSLLIVLFHVLPLRNALLSHLCRKEFCFSCELSFLFNMMNINDTKHQPCSANNFVRTFRSMPEATALGLVLNDREAESSLKNANLSTLIQSFNRFILRQLNSELSDVKSFVKPISSIGSNRSDLWDSPNATPARINAKKTTDSNDIGGSSLSSFASPLNDSAFGGELNSSSSNGETFVEKLFSSKISMSSRCKCGFETTRDSATMVIELNYSNFASENSTQNRTFGELFSKSMCSEQTTHAWCEKCAKFQITSQSKKLFSLPDVLSVNCNVSTDKEKDFWRNQSKLQNDEMEGKSWIDSKFALHLNENGLVDYLEDYSTIDERSIISTKIYQLTAVISLIKDKDNQHLVACVNPKYVAVDDTCPSEWIVYNDFALNFVPADEVLSFDLDWKIPCLLFYSSVDLHEKHLSKAISPIDERVFTLDECLSVRRRLSSSTFVPLEPHELPKKGDIVALDAEFVTLNQEEAEFHSDGTKLMIKPSQMSVARVTCIRGDGPLEGVPFIDDYISTQEEVVDYLTKFSGIKPGDLNPSITSKHLTTLKSTYLKLRYLTDNGVIFVGHGLNNDFKVLNIVVPPEQCIDTVQLFHLPHHRMISLRFLAWQLLGMNIQSETHDSVEDTRTTLKLYKKYLELISTAGESNFNRILTELYEKGRTVKWKVTEDHL